MSFTHRFSVTKPVSVWNQPLKVNFKDLFKSLTKAIVQGVLINWSGVTENALNMLSAVGLSKDPGQLTWLLILRSLEQAIKSLVKESMDLIKHDTNVGNNSSGLEGVPQEYYETLDQQLNLSFEEMKLTIDEAFFNAPGKLPVLEDVGVLFAEWLKAIGLSHAQASSISHRLPAYFVYALNNEWRNNRDKYAPIIGEFNTPFTRASEREYQWYVYSAWLHKQIQEPMFNETFSLQNIYTPPRAYYEEDVTDRRIRIEYDDEAARRTLINEGLIKKDITEYKRKRRVVLYLEDALEQWLSENNSSDAIRVVVGGPGAGKSSITKIFAAKQSGKSKWRILLIPLHRFDIEGDLIKAVGNFVIEEGFLTFNPLDSKEGGEQVLIIFDGLDELSMQGRVGVEVAQRFVQEVQRKVERLNIRELRLKVIISGRDFIIQANSNEFRDTHQILQLLPYYIPASERDDFDLRTRPLLSVDQRHYWWHAYSQSIGKEYVGLPGDLERAGFVEITSQPLLNYLVAVSYVRGELNLSEGTNHNTVYESLIRSVYRRVWAEHQHPSLKGISEEQFLRVLEEIALATWHSAQRKASLHDIEQYCRSSGLTKIFETFQEGIKEGVSRLLIAFYFRKVSVRETGEETFEFTHKSFSEYLTARRILRGLQRISSELERRKEAYDDGWDEPEALIQWIKLCGPVPMDTYLYNYISNELHLNVLTDVEKWQDTLIRLVNFVQRNNIPIEGISPRPPFGEELKQVRNAGVSLLAALAACANVTKRISEITWHTPTTFSNWLSIIHKQRVATEVGLSLQVLTYLDLRGCILKHRDLYGADFQGSNLEGAALDGSNLATASLRAANLRGATLRGSSLYQADCREAFFDDADLTGAFLYRADLSDAVFHGANLQKAHLSNALMYRTDMREANMKEANLVGATLEAINLQKANLQFSDFRAAGMSKSKLKGSLLQGANLALAKLEEADLSNANLEGASLQSANLLRANLENANLRGANLKEANLQDALTSGADFTGAIWK